MEFLGHYKHTEWVGSSSNCFPMFWEFKLLSEAFEGTVSEQLPPTLGIRITFFFLIQKMENDIFLF